jgi:hypothetical protein
MLPTAEQEKKADFSPRAPDLDALIRSFNGFIYICSQDYRIQYMNDKLLERTGYDATGEYCYKILHGCEDICPWCNNDTFYRERKTTSRQLKSPGDGRWYEIISTPISNSDGTLSKQSLLMDITESYLARAELSLFQNLTLRQRQGLLQPGVQRDGASGSSGHRYFEKPRGYAQLAKPRGPRPGTKPPL